MRFSITFRGVSDDSESPSQFKNRDSAVSLLKKIRETPIFSLTRSLIESESINATVFQKPVACNVRTNYVLLRRKIAVHCATHLPISGESKPA